MQQALKKNSFSSETVMNISFKKIYLFTEAGSLFGLGHFSRSSALVKELALNLNPCKVLKIIIHVYSEYAPEVLIETGSLSELFKMNNLKIFCHSPELIINSPDNNQKHILKLIHQINPENHVEQAIENLIILDSYHACYSAYKAAAENSFAIFMDDWFRLDYPKSGRCVIVNPLFDFRPLTNHEKPQKCTPPCNIIKGIEYQILREPFRPSKKNKKNINKNKYEKNILVFFSGAGPGTKDILLTIKMAQALPGIFFYLPGMPGSIAVNNLFGPDTFSVQLPENIIFQARLNARQMAGLIKKCSLAVVCAGQILFECAALGLPAICLKGVDNQDANINFMQAKNLLVDTVDYNINKSTDEKHIDLDTPALKIIQTIKQADPDRLSLLNRRLPKIIDARGAERICRLLQNLIAEPHYLRRKND
jgi:spore coat polysaccharide biosynthesis predicted glycosyltransferase SpsG